MRGFLIDEKGDIIIENGNIALVNGNDLIAQTVKTVLSTNKGEWFLNKDEGINHHYVLGKGITEEMLLNQVQDALSQVNDSLHVTNFEVQNDAKKRAAYIFFKAKGDNGIEINVSHMYGDEANNDAAAKLATANKTLADYRTANERLARRIDGRWGGVTNG